MYQPTSAADLIAHYKRLKRKFRNLKPPEPTPEPSSEPAPVADTSCPKILPAPRFPVLSARRNGHIEVTISMVFRTACKLWQLHPDVFRGVGKWEPLVTYRFVAMYVAIELVPATTMSKVGNYFDRDHSTVVHACRTMRGRINTDEEIRQKVDLLVMAVRQELEEARKLNA